MSEHEHARPSRSIRVTRRHGFGDERIEVHGTVTVRPETHTGDELTDDIVLPIRVWVRPNDIETLGGAGQAIIGPCPGTLATQPEEAEGVASHGVSGRAAVTGQITLALDLDQTSNPRKALPGWGIRTVRTISI